ncbi:MAG: hypothetical protein K940chlam5_00047 [Candidatus Anoxychlamydiales bacterium]|nr:hypothetical protein [Candidatus Anoxychlamydiales bacterium]
MFITKYLPSWFNFNSTTANKKHTKNKRHTNRSNNLLEKTYKYNLSRAVISTSDINLIKVEISGNPESKIFKNEKDLDNYFYSLRKTIDIFKIYDQRKNNSTPTYKYNDIAWEGISNFTKKDSLYYAIASENLGILQINDLNKKKKYYLKKNTKWLFFWSFEKIDQSSAFQTVYNKKKPQESWRKIYAFSLIALSLSPALNEAASSISKRSEK